jgi:hypothetical protein
VHLDTCCKRKLLPVWKCVEFVQSGANRVHLLALSSVGIVGECGKWLAPKERAWLNAESQVRFLAVRFCPWVPSLEKMKLKVSRVFD